MYNNNYKQRMNMSDIESNDEIESESTENNLNNESNETLTQENESTFQ